MAPSCSGAPIRLSVRDDRSEPRVAVLIPTNVGIDERLREVALTVFPNPVQDQLRVTGTEDLETWAVLDATGRVVLSDRYRATRSGDRCTFAQCRHVPVPGSGACCHRPRRVRGHASIGPESQKKAGHRPAFFMFVDGHQ